MTKEMTARQRALAVLRFQPYDRLPLVHFGFWPETLQKWAEQGHLTQKEATEWFDGNLADETITRKLGFDHNWFSTVMPNSGLNPPFEEKVVKEFPDGSQHRTNLDGAIVLAKPETGSIPAEVDHLLQDPESWEKHYKWRMKWTPDRVENALVRVSSTKMLPYHNGGLEFLQSDHRSEPYGLFCGSMFGRIRDILGLENTCILCFEEPELIEEMIQAFSNLCYLNTKKVLEDGARVDFLHFWEDICFKNGPLVIPDWFYKNVGHHYKRVTDLVRQHGIDIVSLDCDGMIDELIPTWLDHGVNTMFPIEVGTWKASIAPWREEYGPQILGVGGMNKVAFSKDKAAIDNEVERMKPLVNLGGYIPCPDHRIAPDAKWDLVCYYCERMRQEFS